MFNCGNLFTTYAEHERCRRHTHQPESAINIRMNKGAALIDHDVLVSTSFPVARSNRNVSRQLVVISNVAALSSSLALVQVGQAVPA